MEAFNFWFLLKVGGKENRNRERSAVQNCSYLSGKVIYLVSAKVVFKKLEVKGKKSESSQPCR